jgi:hypothetical protein
MMGSVPLERHGTKNYALMINRLSQRHSSSVFPLDHALNLPQTQYSFGLRKRLISEAIKGSFDESVQSIKTTTGGHVPKRQALMLVDDASEDFCAFYERVRFSKPEDTHDLLITPFFDFKHL